MLRVRVVVPAIVVEILVVVIVLVVERDVGATHAGLARARDGHRAPLVHLHDVLHNRLGHGERARVRGSRARLDLGERRLDGRRGRIGLGALLLLLLHVRSLATSLTGTTSTW